MCVWRRTLNAQCLSNVRLNPAVECERAILHWNVRRFPPTNSGSVRNQGLSLIVPEHSTTPRGHFRTAFPKLHYYVIQFFASQVHFHVI